MGTYKKIDSFKFPLSLERLACVSFGAHLWKRKDLHRVIEDFFRKNRDERVREKQFEKIVRQVTKPLENLELPWSVKSKLIYVSKFMGMNLYNWIEFLGNNLYKDLKSLNYARDILCVWNHYGEVNKVGSFRALLSSKKRRKSAAKMFNIACYLCLENYLHSLWRKIPKSLRQSFYMNSVFSEARYHLIAYWVSRIKKDAEGILYLLDNNQIHDVNVCMCKISIRDGHDVAVEYFWECMSPELREENIYLCDFDVANMPVYPEYAKILCFFFGQMQRSQIRSLIQSKKKFERLVEILIFNPPWHEFIIPFLDLIYGVIKPEQYMHMLLFMSQTIPLNHEYDAYTKILLRVLWFKTPADYKQGISLDNFGVIATLLEVEDFDSVRIIRNDPVVAYKNIFPFGMIRFCNLIRTGRFDVLLRYENEVLSSDLERRGFHSVIMEHAFNIYGDLLQSNKNRLAKQFVDWLYGPHLPHWVPISD